MRLRTVLTATIFTAAAAAAGAAFVASWWIGAELVRVSVHEQLRSNMAQFRLQIEREADHAQTLAEFIGATPEIVDAFAAGNRQRLLSLVQPGFELAKAQGVAQFHFHTPPATSFLRVHAPDRYGDDLTSYRHTVEAANRQRKIVRGVEIGFGGLGIRAVTPIAHHGRHIGTVEFGMALGQTFLDRYRDLTGEMTAVYLIGKDHFSRKDRPKLLASTLPPGLEISSADMAAALAGDRRIEASQSIERQCYAIAVEPLRDYSGEVIGLLALAVNRSPLDAIHRLTIMIFGALGLMVLCIGGISAWRINRDLGTPLAGMTRSMSDLAEGRLDVRIDAASRIVEVQAMAHALQVFAHALAAKREGERQLEASKARFEALVEATAEVVWTENAKGEVEEDSPSWRAFTGLDFDDYKGMGWLRAIHPDDREGVLAGWRRASETRSLHRTEHRLRHASGEWRWVQVNAVPLLDATGAVREWIGMSADITERKEAEYALRRMNRALLTLGSGNEALMRAENEHELLESMCRVFVETGGYRIAWIGLRPQDQSAGVKPDACVGLEDNRLAEEILYPAAGRSQRPAAITMATGTTQVARDVENDPDFAACAHNLRELGVKTVATFALKKEAETFGVCVVYSADAKAYDADEIKLLEQLAADLAYGIQSLRANVERKTNMENLHAAALYIRSLFEASLDMFVTVAPDGSIADVNRASERILGTPPLRAIGQDFASFFTDPAKARAGLHEAFTKGSISDLSLAIRHPSGEVTSLMCNASVFRDQHGAVVGVFAAGRDVTELERVQRELQRHREHLEELIASRTEDLAEANEKLTRANEEMEAFSYSVSHDLRVPLRAVNGFSTILLEDYQDKLDDDGKRMLGVVRENATKMGVLIDDILAFSRIGRAQITKEPIDMNEMVRSVLKELEQAAPSRKITYALAPLPSAEADPAMIRRVWTNLLDNAMKYTSQKSEAVIEVGSSPGRGETIYHIRDNGAGFDMKYANKLFGVFQRLHGQEFSGTGVGLANVKRIIARHGGRVWAEGAPNEGATFYFSLPAPASAKTSAAA